MDENMEGRGDQRGRGVRGRGRGRGRGGGRGGGRRGGRGGRVRRRGVISDDMRATLIDHVVNHGLTMPEAGQRVQPHISRFSVAAIIRTFRRGNRKKHYYDRKTLV